MPVVSPTLPYRAGLVWLAATVVPMGAFAFFAAGIGWPARPDGCAEKGCCCERFSLADAEAGARGVRRPSDTWFNLYVIGASLAILAIGNAVPFRAPSDTGRPLCDPDGSFQPHGVLWRPSAGAVALVMFVRWRREGVPGARPAGSAASGGRS